jgi:hypothetical protein
MAAPPPTTVGPGPDVVIPGSQQLLPVALLLLALIAVVALVVGLVLRRRRARRGAPRRPPVVVATAATVALVAAGLAFVNRPPPFFVPKFVSLPRLLPADAFFYRRADDLPVAADSRRWIAAEHGEVLAPNFAGEVSDGIVWGIPFNLVNRSTPTEHVSIRQGQATSYPGPYPISDPAYIQSMPTYGVDQHYVAIDTDRKLMWELVSARAWFGRWEADYGALWHLDSLAYGQGSTIAARLPLMPGVLTYDDIARGHVDHVVLAGSPTSAAGRWIWPAHGTDGRSTDPDAPPQGAWFRLKAGVDLSHLGPQARIVAVGLQRYGAILSDTGPGFKVRGTPDARWDDADLQTLRTLTTDDFEVVDPAGVMVSPDSMAARPAPGA